MLIIETNHFSSQWAKRIGTKPTNLKKLIKKSIKSGRARRHRRSELGILVPVRVEDATVYVLGIPTKHEFILKTVLNAKMAERMGWRVRSTTQG